jgi:plasmid stabilization system protein ParE
MIVRWTERAVADVERLHRFLLPHDAKRADELLDKLVAAPVSLVEFPRRGSRCPGFEEREVREFRIDRYVMRYELAADPIQILRIFHAREDRS